MSIADKIAKQSGVRPSDFAIHQERFRKRMKMAKKVKSFICFEGEQDISDIVLSLCQFPQEARFEVCEKHGGGLFISLPEPQFIRNANNRTQK